MIDREAIIADAVNGETTAIARRHGCTVQHVHEILDGHEVRCAAEKGFTWA